MIWPTLGFVRPRERIEDKQNSQLLARKPLFTRGTIMPLENKERSTADDAIERAVDKQQLAAWEKVCEALMPLPKDRKKRVLEAAAIMFDVE